jgi:Cu-Zn family superoxide dismutase
LIDSGVTTGSHFNPQKKLHAGPLDENRHAGDLGNIFADDDGIGYLEYHDNLISIYGGVFNVIGRSIVICDKEDDLGKHGNDESLKNGNTGLVIGTGVIGLSGPLSLDSKY